MLRFFRRFSFVSCIGHFWRNIHHLRSTWSRRLVLLVERGEDVLLRMEEDWILLVEDHTFRVAVRQNLLQSFANVAEAMLVN